jgi:hypothetical protein
MAQAYRGSNEDGQIADMRERLRLTWFVESGVTRYEQTGFIDGVTGDFAGALENRWKPGVEKDSPAAAARIVVVIRDNRGGVSWRSGAVSLGASR